MFKNISPSYQRYYKGRIDLFMGLMGLYQDVSLVSEEQRQATFIIGEDENQVISGGAILHKYGVSDLPHQLQAVISTFDPHKEEIWMCTLSCFIEDKVLPLEDKVVAYKAFYRNLFEKFIEFGDEEKVRYLCLTLNPFEHRRTKNKGLWPYILEIQPQDSLDGLFHGILSLSPRKVKAYGSTHSIHFPTSPQLAA